MRNLIDALIVWKKMMRISRAIEDKQRDNIVKSVTTRELVKYGR